MTPIYLDYAASTPLSKPVLEKMTQVMSDPMLQGNASSSSHQYGWRARDLIVESRKTVAELIGCSHQDIVFTSNATESNNLVIRGVIEHALNGKKDISKIHLVTSAIEHKSVLDVFKKYESKGASVTYLQPNAYGLITAKSVSDVLQKNTILVSVMFINNELGNINDVTSIASTCFDFNIDNKTTILFHTDATQAIGRIPLSLENTCINYLTFSGHKIYGPKGIGAICFNSNGANKCKKTLFGGSQELGFKPGTQANHQIAGFAEACLFFTDDSRVQDVRIKYDNLRQHLLDELTKGKLDFSLNSNHDNSYPGIVNIYIPNIDSEMLMAMIPYVSISTGSACNSRKEESSYVVNAINKSKGLEQTDNEGANIRVSFGLDTTVGMVSFAAESICEAVAKYKSI